MRSFLVVALLALPTACKKTDPSAPVPLPGSAPVPGPTPLPVPVPVPVPVPASVQGDPPTDAPASCLSTADCPTGSLCEGEGCGPETPGTCIGNNRACTRDLRPYCGCEGQTFLSGGTCPLRRYAHKGPCP